MATPEILTLSVLHAGRKERMVMRSLLNLISGRGEGAEWHLIEEPGGDVTIIDVDGAAGEQAWSAMVRPTGTLIAMTQDAAFDAPVVLQKPLRSRDFLQLLARVVGDEFIPAAIINRNAAASARTRQAQPAVSAGTPTETAVKATSPEPTPVSESTSASETGLTLADHLRGQTWSSPVALTTPGWPLLLIDPCSGTWFFDGAIGDLDPARFARPIPASAGVALSNSELVERIQGHRQRTLSELKWYAGLAQFPGRLHPELRGEPEFMLTQVPPEAMKNELLHDLARIVLRGPTDLENLLAESGQPEANVSAFLNACFCSGKLLVNRTS